jgi:hypothetical protein
MFPAEALVPESALETAGSARQSVLWALALVSASVLVLLVLAQVPDQG